MQSSPTFKRIISTNMTTISVCMIVKDAASSLNLCLESVKEITDELVVVDTGSKDDTKTIAQNFGAKIYDFSWENSFSKARNESLKHATKEWILVIDADELLQKKDAHKVKELITSTKEHIGGFKLQQRSYLAKPHRKAKRNNSTYEKVAQYPFYVQNNLVRLFRNDDRIRFRHRVHELVEDSIIEAGLEYVDSEIPLHHLGSLDRLTSEKEKTYADLVLQQLAENPKNPRYNYQAAMVYLMKGESDPALKYFTKVAKLDPSYRNIFSEMAKIHIGKKEYDQAITCFKKAMKQHPEEASCVNNLAVAYMFKGDFENARKLLETYRKKHPENEAILHNYREALANLKKNQGS